MEPTINIGDIVFTKETDKIEKNDIISFKEKNVIITHRVTDILIDDNNKKQYQTKGDANSSEDSLIVKKENIEGKYIFKIPLLGKLIMFFRTKLGIVLLIVAFSLISFFIFYMREKPKSAGKDNRMTKRGKHSGKRS